MMKAARFLVLALVMTGGCSSSAPDPCSDRPAPCLSVRVEGNVKPDQLELAIGGTVKHSPPTATSTPFDLPVDVALMLPGGTTGQISLTTRALRSRAVIAVDREESATLNAEGYGKLTVHLEAEGTDAAADAEPADGGDRS